jgi:inosose dehydratase
MVTRRELLASLASLVGSASGKTVRLKADTTANTLQGLSSYAVSGFSRTMDERTADQQTAKAASMRFGYAAITWGSELAQAMDDIASVGFQGIQLRGEAFAQFGDRPAALREALERHHLTFVALSSGNLSIDPAREREELATHVQHAQFVRATGGLYLQVIDERPKGRAITADDYRRLGRLMTELGKRTADVGVPLVYHHHMNSLGERPKEVEAVLDAADRKYVRVLFDVAHYQQGGGDPVADLRKYREWIEVLHLKDVRPVPAAPGSSGPASAAYQFVELGRGRVDLPGVFAALRDIKFTGWAVVELDRVPDAGRTAKESAEINKRFLVGKGFAIGG